MATFIRPSTVTHITNSFAGHKARGSVNPGVDYGAGTGTNVVAPADGKVFRARWSSSVGYYLVIHHSNGWSSDLLHNSKLLVKEGATVKAGQHIAESGGTGSVATGPHIHWSLRANHSGVLQNIGNVDGEKYVAKVDPFDSWITDAYVRKLEAALKLTVNGSFSSTDIKVLQKFLKVTADGKFGGNSAKALQKFVGVSADGIVGTATKTAFKKAIDAGKFGAVPTAEATRKTGAKVVNVRPLPSTKPAATVQAKADTNYVVTGFAHAEAVTGNDVWFQLKSGLWAWSGGFTSTATTGLKEVTVATPPVVTPPAGPTQAQYDAVVKERDVAKAALAAAQTIVAAVRKAVA